MFHFQNYKILLITALLCLIKPTPIKTNENLVKLLSWNEFISELHQEQDLPKLSSHFMIAFKLSFKCVKCVQWRQCSEKIECHIHAVLLFTFLQILLSIKSRFTTNPHKKSKCQNNVPTHYTVSSEMVFGDARVDTKCQHF